MAAVPHGSGVAAMSRLARLVPFVPFASLAAPLALALATSLAGCAADDSGHTLTMSASLAADGAGELAFLSPSATIATHTPADVVGKPYYVGVFPAGFSPGNDPALYQRWGTIPASLTMTETTPATFAPGPYDMVFVMYTNTPISAAQLAFEQSPPAAAGGDLSSFTLSAADVLPGDPDQALGTIRMNVVDGDARVDVVNRTPTDPANRDQITASFEHTVLIIP